MEVQRTIRSWRDDDYLTSLSDEERQELLPSPAGVVELPDEDLGIYGEGTTLPCIVKGSKLLDCAESIGEGTCHFLTLGCCDAQTIGGSCEVYTFGCCEPTDAV